MGECLASCLLFCSQTPMENNYLTDLFVPKGLVGFFVHTEFLEMIRFKALIPIMTLLEVLLLHLAHTHHVQWVTVERTSPSLIVLDGIY